MLLDSMVQWMVLVTQFQLSFYPEGFPLNVQCQRKTSDLRHYSVMSLKLGTIILYVLNACMISLQGPASMIIPCRGQSFWMCTRTVTRERTTSNPTWHNHFREVTANSRLPCFAVAVRP